MKDFFKNLISQKEWLIKEANWNRRFQNIWESLFTLGNGYLGSRGILEEIPYDANRGTYIAGIYDRAGAQVTELVNLPNPINFKIAIQGEKIDVVAMDILKHERILDMKKGFLKRRTLFSDAQKHKFDYQSLRFFSKDTPHIGVMKICFTPLDKPVEILVESSIDTSVTNQGILSEGRKKHCEITELTNFGEIDYLEVRTFESKISIGYASYLKVNKGTRSFSTSEDSFYLKLKKGETVYFTKNFSVYTSRDTKNVKEEAVRALRKNLSLDFKGLLNKHMEAWAKAWDLADISIESDRELQRALRFNIYHLLICGTENNGKASIGARTLSGEGYRGHIFWDTEIFILPFFIYTNPLVARNMLLYRYRTLNQARLNAKEAGFKGALFAWEAADTGREETPQWHRDLNGSVIKIHTGEMEKHIVGDIAYAVYHYYLATNDKEFMSKFGLELFFETARFWASYGRFNKNKTAYHIPGVIGPDEFHINVTDNAYTNTLAKFNLTQASQLYWYNKQNNSRLFRKLIKKIKLTDKEVRFWEELVSKIVIPSQKGLIEAFHGYFRKKYIPIKELDSNFMPVLPRNFPLENIGQTQFVKQADVIMIFHLFPEDYSFKQKRENFVYYDKRTLHKSSLSPSVSAAVGWNTGNCQKAFQYFRYGLYADLRNYHDNTQEGIHAASLGGSWQVMINAFAGFRLKEEAVLFTPFLPPDIKSMKFKLKIRRNILSVCIRKKNMEISPRLKEGNKIKVKICNEVYFLRNNRKHVFKYSGNKSQRGSDVKNKRRDG